MDKLFRIACWIVGAVTLLGIVYLIGIAAFLGAFDKKYTREELTENFTKNEKEFEDLIIFFNAKTAGIKDFGVCFSSDRSARFTLWLRPVVIDPKNKTLGGVDLELGSAKLDSALRILGWKNNTVITLTEMLVETNCNTIQTTDYYGGNPIEMRPYQTGWSSYDYHIFPKPLNDSLKRVLGRTISSSTFGRRVTLVYSTAL